MGLCEASNTKSLVSETNAKKPVRIGSSKTGQNGQTIPFSKSRRSENKSHKPTDGKLSLSTRTNSSTEKQVRVPKAPCDSQSPRDFTLEEIKKLRKQLEDVEDEKAKALEELLHVNNLVGETKEKLAEALVAQKKAQEGSDVEKFRADELEQESIESSHEIERIRAKHAAEIDNLISKCSELESASHAALSQADEAMKVKDEELAALSEEFAHLKSSFDLEMKKVSNENAKVVKELNVEIANLKIQLDLAKEAESKVVELEAMIEEIRMEAELAKKSESDANKLAIKNTEMVHWLSFEVDDLKCKLEQSKIEEAKLMEMERLIVRLRGDLASTRKSESDAKKVASENSKTAKRLSSEIDGLKEELERVKLAETKVAEMKNLIEGLRIDLAAAKESEAKNTRKIIDEWKNKVELLEVRLEEATQSEQSAQESLATTIRQVVEANVKLQETESQIVALGQKIDSLDNEMARREKKLEESNVELSRAREEAFEKGRKLEVLKSEVRVLEESKMQLLENEKDLVSSIEKLTNEKEKLMKELEIAADQNEKSLALSLREASAEVRDMQERLLAKHDELEDARAHIRSLESDLRNTEENYQVLLDEAKYEIVCLRKAVERSETTQFEETIEVENGQANVRDEQNPKDLNMKENLSNSARNEEPIEVEIKTWEDHKMIEEIERGETDSAEEEFYVKANEKRSFDQRSNEVLASENTENMPSSSTLQLQQQKKKSLLLNKFGNFFMKK